MHIFSSYFMIESHRLWDSRTTCQSLKSNGGSTVFDNKIYNLAETRKFHRLLTIRTIASASIPSKANNSSGFPERGNLVTARE